MHRELVIGSRWEGRIKYNPGYGPSKIMTVVSEVDDQGFFDVGLGKGGHRVATLEDAENWVELDKEDKIISVPIGSVWKVDSYVSPLMPSIEMRFRVKRRNWKDNSYLIENLEGGLGEVSIEWFNRDYCKRVYEDFELNINTEQVSGKDDQGSLPLEQSPNIYNNQESNRQVAAKEDVYGWNGLSVIDNPIKKITGCLCGCEKVGSKMHSDWCPKYKEVGA